MSEDHVAQKRCTKCNEIKPLDAFAKKSGRSDGRRSECKACAAEHTRTKYAANPEEARAKKQAQRAANPGRDLEHGRARRAANPEKFREQKRQWRADNPEKVSAQNHRYRENNLDTIKAIQRRWYINNIERISAHQFLYRQENRERLRAKDRAYYTSNPEKFRLARQIRRVRLRGNGGSCTLQELRALRVEQNYECAYCRRVAILHIEHIIPVSRGGTGDISNICWACRRCNLNKSNKLLSEWTNRWYYTTFDEPDGM